MKEKTAILLIDHGSRRKAANHMLFDMVKLMRTLRQDVLVYGAHMELAVPTISDGIAWCVKQNVTYVVAVPYMLSPGRHAKEDIPRMVTDALESYPTIQFEVTEPLGVAEELASLVFKRAKL